MLTLGCVLLLSPLQVGSLHAPNPSSARAKGSRQPERPERNTASNRGGRKTTERFKKPLSTEQRPEAHSQVPRASPLRAMAPAGSRQSRSSHPQRPRETEAKGVEIRRKMGPCSRQKHLHNKVHPKKCVSKMCCYFPAPLSVDLALIFVVCRTCRS